MEGQEKSRKLFNAVMYSSPDGKNVNEKVYYTSLISLGVGAAFGLAVCRHKGMKTSWRHNIGLFAQTFTPVVGTGVTYAYMSQKAAEYRQKDGPMNHFLGVLPAAPFLAMFYRKGDRIRVLTPLLFFGISAAVLKYESGLNLEDYSPNIQSMVPKKSK